MKLDLNETMRKPCSRNITRERVKQFYCSSNTPRRSWPSNICIMTLLFMGLAVAVGAAFGGVRVLLKMIFPGKIFDRPDQMEVLQLGLSGSKRIDSRDFY